MDAAVWYCVGLAAVVLGSASLMALCWAWRVGCDVQREADRRDP